MVLFSSDTVRLYCVGWWTLTKSEWFRQNIRFVSLMFSRSLGIFKIKCLRRRKTFLATCIFEVIRLQATCFQLIAGSTPSRFLCQWLQAQVLLLEVIIHLLTGASPWLNLYLYILAPSLSYTTKVAVYLLYSCCTFDGLLVLNVLERFSYDLELKTREQNRNNKQRKQSNLIGFVERIQTRVAFGPNARVKKLHTRELSRNQPILRFDVILLHDWPIEQCLLYSRVFFGGKTKRPCFDLFNHWLIKQITDTYRNIFQGRYENRSILNINGALLLHQLIIVTGLGFCSMKFAFMAVPV